MPLHFRMTWRISHKAISLRPLTSLNHSLIRGYAKEFEIALEHPLHAGLAPSQDHFAFKSQAGPA